MRDTDVLFLLDITVSIEKSGLFVVVSYGIIISMLRANGLILVILSQICKPTKKQTTLLLNIGFRQLLLWFYLIPKLLRLDLHFFLPGILKKSFELLSIGLDYSLNLIDDVIDLMLAEFWYVSLRWKRVERFYYGLTLAYQSNEFDIVIPVALPGRIGDNLV